MEIILFLQSLSDRVDYLKKRIDNLTEVIEEKDTRISELERVASTTETKLDALKQYSSHANLWFQGLKENKEGEDIEAKIINIINNEIGLTPRFRQMKLYTVIESGVRHVSPVALALWWSSSSVNVAETPSCVSEETSRSQTLSLQPYLYK